MFMPSGIIAAASGSEERTADYVVIAEQDQFLTGYSRISLFGELVPDQPYGKNQINSIHSIIPNQWLYLLEPVAGDNDQSFIDIQLTGLFTTGQQTIILRRDESDLPGEDSWLWQDQAGEFIDGNSYDMAISYLT